MVKVARIQERKTRGERHDLGMKSRLLEDAPLLPGVEKNGSKPPPPFLVGIGVEPDQWELGKLGHRANGYVSLAGRLLWDVGERGEAKGREILQRWLIPRERR
jgi:hypothetical protein